MRYSKNQGVPFSTSDGVGADCEYCKRALKSTTDTSELAARREHIRPKCRGGTRRVWACKKCDVLKGNKDEAAWKLFMRRFPQWWKWKIFPDEY